MAALPMACHKDSPASVAHPLRLCAGWLAVVGPHHTRMRMYLVLGVLAPQALYPDTRTWPPLHPSLADLLASRDEQLRRAGHPHRAETSSQPPMGRSGWSRNPPMRHAHADTDKTGHG